MRLTIDLLDPSDYSDFPELRDQSFEGHRIVLDNGSYVRCHFRRCVLVYAGGPCKFVDCDVDSECSLLLTGAAAKGYAIWMKVNQVQQSEHAWAPNPTDAP